MENTFLKKATARAHYALVALCAGMLIVSAILPTAGFAQQSTPYEDVPEGAWYEDAVKGLLKSGALDPDDRFLRPQARATRAEMAELLVRVSGGTRLYPATPSFDDVPKSTSFFSYIEAAAKAGWMRGDQNCYDEKKHPCTARPSDGLNRAEAAALLARTFVLAYLNEAPVFFDNDSSEWYFISIQTAADYCILQGDDVGKSVRPGAFMNRAEMITMFHRASQNLLYGKNCGEPAPLPPPDSSLGISAVNPITNSRLRVTFSDDVRSNIADNADQYVVTSQNGRVNVEVESVTIVNKRTVELLLAKELESNLAFTLTARNIQSENGAAFTASATFTVEAPALGHIIDVETLSPIRIRIIFDTNIDELRAEEERHYTVTGVEGTLDIGLAILQSPRMVELTLSESMEIQESYVIQSTGLETSGGAVFSDNETIIYNETQPITFRASLRGSNEVPPVTTLASGTGIFTLTYAGLQYDITVAGLSGSIVGAHFHRATVGMSGPVIEPLTFNGNRAIGTWTDLTGSERHDILHGEIYVNVHSQEYPDGEIRGQVVRQ